MISRARMLTLLAVLGVLNCVYLLGHIRESVASDGHSPSASNKEETFQPHALTSSRSSSESFSTRDQDDSSMAYAQQKKAEVAQSGEQRIGTSFDASGGTGTAEQGGYLAVEPLEQAVHVPTWLMYTATSPYTYKAARSFCKGEGGALCTRRDICPGGLLSKLIRGNPNDQTSPSKDKWTPYSDAENGWIQTGGGRHAQCKDRVGFAKAAWGISGARLFGIGTTMCCVLPAVEKTTLMVPISTSQVAQGLDTDNGDHFGGTDSRNGGDCSVFENVELPLEADEWGSNIRPAKGVSIYGTGWAQRRLREHQFPLQCDGQSFVEHGMFRSGMGANMHISAAVLAHALNWGSIYVWPEDDSENPWTEGANKTSAIECPNGLQTRTYECYLKPISSCKSDGLGPKFIGMAKARGKKTLRGTEVIPDIFKPLLRCSGYPKDYWRKWWRAQATAFILRPNPAMHRALTEFRTKTLVNNVWPGTIGAHVRHGDKYYEATEYPFEDY
eukprot:TRINITY_DN88668_c0_g1_i1.p1 TRINITY_DN88668_c0_g1~~TRINITY_DN88668_c0_g1_i1.p1  ORF type:complete len:499 (+),score=55.99 TRINITY_DN88668_c0_g1_i1:180-1676(+)